MDPGPAETGLGANKPGWEHPNRDRTEWGQPELSWSRVRSRRTGSRTHRTGLGVLHASVLSVSGGAPGPFPPPFPSRFPRGSPRGPPNPSEEEEGEEEDARVCR